MDDNRARWIDLHVHNVQDEFEENIEENEDADNDSDIDVMSDDSGYGSNSEEEDNHVEMTLDSESEDELISDFNENVKSAYLVLGEVQGLPEALLLQKTSWREFERQIIDEICSRHYAWELDIMFERQFLLETGVYEHWCRHIFRLQTRVSNLIPNIRILNTAGVLLGVCKMSGTINMHVSEIGSFYKIILKVEHRGRISAII